MINKFPFYKQHDMMDCGPSCLKMIAQFYGKTYSLDKLRERCFVSREGVSLLNISEAAESIGFHSMAGKFTFENLVKNVTYPFIVHWEQNHFVVVYKIKLIKKFGKLTDTIFYIANPGSGLLKYTKDEFLKGWISSKSNDEEKGIALLLKPSNDFYNLEEDKERKSNFSFLASYLFRYKKYFVQLLLGLFIASILQLIFPFLTQSIVDIGIKDQNIGFIYLVLLAQLVLFISRESINFIRGWLLLHISTRVNISLISDFLIKLMKLPMQFFDTKLMGDLLQRIEDHNRVERFLTAQTLNVIFSFFSFFILGIVLLFYSQKIFLIFLIGSILYTIWILLFLKKRRRLDYKLFEQRAKNQSKIYQLINGMQEIKLQNCEKRMRWEWEDVQADLYNTNIQSLSLWQYQEAGGIFINELKNIIITVVAATAVIHGQLTLGMMLAIQYIIGQLNNPIDQLKEFIHNTQDVSLSIERINEIHTKQEEETNVSYKTNQLSENKNIVIKDVTFQYEGPHSEKVLKNLNFSIPEGKVTAIVGTSGSGKTTLIKLLLGYYKPIDGEIRIGDSPLESMEIKWWRDQCGAVMQDGFIFSESIARNIAVSTYEVDKSRLLNAVNVANIKDFITSLPLAYNTIIGQEGQGLSQGQKQRILIARAVYKNPEFLFFDEATNALDANNEKKIIQNLSKFYVGKTAIIVAHRLSTVKGADQIVVLDKGEVVEIGNHETLTAKRGAYYQLVKNQLELGS